MTLKEHHKNKIPMTIEQALKSSLCTIDRIVYFRYNDVFEAYLNKGNSRNKSYDFAADECGCSRITIIKAVQFCNQTVV